MSSEIEYDDDVSLTEDNGMRKIDDLYTPIKGGVNQESQSKSNNMDNLKADGIYVEFDDNGEGEFPS